MYIAHITGQQPEPAKRKVSHRTKAFMDNLEREILLDHNKKITKKLKNL